MTDNIRIPRMRTIKETAELFDLPVHFVRQKVNDGEIVAVRAGRRFLVNIDRFAEYLDSNTIPQESKADSGIQPIALR
ncbi:MAG: helix-turn-helix domain-containing protein [Ruminiclostridium sp.]|nr:helix-turn-helix domain-containing protein [Ruminiclostridium sp.]